MVSQQSAGKTVFFSHLFKPVVAKFPGCFLDGQSLCCRKSDCIKSRDKNLRFILFTQTENNACVFVPPLPPKTKKAGREGDVHASLFAELRKPPGAVTATNSQQVFLRLQRQAFFLKKPDKC